MLLQTLITEINTLKIIGSTHIDIKAITHDSRKTTTNSLYCAIKGFSVNGHAYIDEAIDRGAVAILCTDLPHNIINSITYIQVTDVKEAMAIFSHHLHGQPSNQIHMTGITGTNGKTSITRLLKHIYQYASKKIGTIGTLGITIGNEELPTSHTTPESTDLHATLGLMAKRKIQNCFMEVSSHALDLRRVDQVNFRTGIFTNLTPDHLCFHGTMEAYYQAKKKLFYMTKDMNIINIDDAYGQRLYEALLKDGRPVISYAIDKEADYRGHILSTNATGTTFLLVTKSAEMTITIKTPGKFSVYNHLAAIASAHQDHLCLDQIVDSLEFSSGADGRFELLTKSEDFHVVLDFAHTPDGLENVLNTVAEFTTGRRIVVFGAGGNRDHSRRYPMGQVAGKLADYCILTTDNPRHENPLTICQEIAEGVKENHPNFKIILDRQEAVKHAISTAKRGDTVLLAGKAYEYYQVVGDQKVFYDEKEIALKALTNR